MSVNYTFGNIYTTVTSTTYNASIGETILVKDSLSILNLPENPVSGSYVKVFFDSAYSGTLNIGRYGKNINGLFANYRCDVKEDIIIEYVNNTIGWLIKPINFTSLSDGQINTSDNFTLYISEIDGSAWAWGLNNYGQLGNSSRTSYSSPVSVKGNISFIQLSARGDEYSLGIRGSDGTGWAWGRNINGVLGIGSVASKSSPNSILGGISWIQLTSGLYNSSTGDITSAGIRGSDGLAFAWGANRAGMLGDGTVNERSSPTLVVGGQSYIKISTSGEHSLAIRGSDGTVWAWGYNSYGQLGDSSRTSRSSPVAVVGGISFVDITTSHESSIGIRGSDGTAWSWGSNSYGTLGLGASGTSKSSPNSVLGGISYIKIYSGHFHVIGIRGSDGSAWAWGTNTYGQLGDNSRTGRNSPVSVVGNMSVSTLSTYGSTSAFMKDGLIWMWGDNTAGQFGNLSTESASSPVSVKAYLS